MAKKDDQKKNGFTLVELLIAVAILGIIAVIAVPQYLGYIRDARQKAADNALEQFSILLETFRAENGQFPGGGPYQYSEDGNGTPVNHGANGIEAVFPDFLPRPASADKAPFRFIVTVNNPGAANETAVVRVIGVDEYANYNAGATFD